MKRPSSAVRQSFAGIVLTVMLVLSMPIPAETAEEPGPTDSLAAEIQTLCRQLDSDVLSDRITAERRLLKLGPRVLPLLPSSESLPSVAVREYVRRVRNQLEQQKARNSVLASHVTLRGTFVFDAILRAIQMQTGNQLDASTLPLSIRNQELPVDWQRKAFWSAMDWLAERVSIGYGVTTPNGTLVLVAKDERRSRLAVGVSYTKAFRVAAERLPLRAIPRDRDHRLLPVEWTVRSEPRLSVLSLTYAETDFEATTAAQKRLLPYSPDATFTLPLGTGRRRVVFVAPKNADLSGLTIRGKFVLQIASDIENFSFPNLTKAAGQTQRRGAVSVTIDDVEFSKTARDTSQVRVRVRVIYDVGGSAFESYQTWIVHNRVYLETRSGQRVELNHGFDTALQTDGAVLIDYRFDGLQAPIDEYRFTYRAPTLIVDVPAEFECAGPLPFPHRSLNW